MPNQKILIVEDEAIISLGIEAELETLGYQVAGSAYDGESALRLVETNQPDLVLMDINLRGKLDGVETALAINANHDIPIIFLSALVDEGTIERTKQCNPYGYVIKPIRSGVLRTSIEHAITKHETEVKLHQSEARFRELYETSLDGIVSSDPVGIILECNPAFAELLGYSIPELMGINITSLTPPEFLPGEERYLEEQVRETGIPEAYAKEFYHKDGHRIPVSVQIWAKRGVNNQTAGYWGIVRDISTLKAKEEKIFRQTAHASTLVRLTSLLNRHYELDGLFELICTEIVNVLDVDVAAIFLVDAEEVQLELAHYHVPVKAFDRSRIVPIPLQVYQQYLQDDEAFLIKEDLKADLSELHMNSTIASFNVNSTIVLNLSGDAKLIGALILATIGRPRNFPQEEVRFLQAFANQAAIAIDRARLYQQVRTRMDELNILSCLSTQLRAAINPQEMLPTLLEAAMELTQAGCGIIYLLGNAGNPVGNYEQASDHLSLGAWFPPRGPLWARALASDAIIEHTLDPHSLETGAGRQTNLGPIRSLVVFSMRSANVIVAIVALGFVSAQRLEEHIKRVLASLAEMGGNALHRSGLLAMLERRVSDRSSELRTLYDLSVFINSPMPFDEKLDGALQRTLACVRADSGFVFKYEVAGQRLVLETQLNSSLEILPQVSEVDLTSEIVNWLEHSAIPWLAIHGDGQSMPLDIRGLSIFKTVINLPIRVEDETIGLLCVLWKDRMDLSAENIALLIAMTERIGSAIHNERLRQKSEASTLLEERQRLARELHDSVTQTLYSQTLLAEAAGDMIAAGERERLENCLADMRENSLQALREMRLLLFQLRPALAGEKDIVEALQNRLDAVERRAGIRTSLEIEGTVGLPAKDQDELYRVAIEALNNSLKHSGADAVRVGLYANENGLRLTIADDGKGFAYDGVRSVGMGLSGMQERVNKLGGQLTIESDPGKGTHIDVRLGRFGE